MSEELKIKRSYAIPENEMVIIKDTHTLLHNIVDSELKEKDKEIERLNNDFSTLKLLQLEHLKEIERLNNIINELEKHLQNEIHKGRSEDNVWLMGCYDEDREILDKLQELKGSDKN